MKKYFWRTNIILCFLLLATQYVVGQKQNNLEKCPALNDSRINLFISGYRDTIPPNEMPARIINAKKLFKGFELLSSDTLIKVRSYSLTFLDEDGNINRLSTRESVMANDRPHVVDLNKITGASSVAITEITVEFRGMCYSMRPQFYYLENIAR